jgi:hypothetical protein
VITVSLPGDTPLGLPGGVQEREFGLWIPVEDRRWRREGDRIVAMYTHEEVEIVVGMMEVNDAPPLAEAAGVSVGRPQLGIPHRTYGVPAMWQDHIERALVRDE